MGKAISESLNFYSVEVPARDGELPSLNLFHPACGRFLRCVRRRSAAKSVRKCGRPEAEVFEVVKLSDPVPAVFFWSSWIFYSWFFLKNLAHNFLHLLHGF